MLIKYSDKYGQLRIEPLNLRIDNVVLQNYTFYNDGINAPLIDYIANLVIEIQLQKMGKIDDMIRGCDLQQCVSVKAEESLIRFDETEDSLDAETANRLIELIVQKIKTNPVLLDMDELYKKAIKN